MVEMRRPITLMKSQVEGWIGPRVSMATDWKMCVEGSSPYLLFYGSPPEPTLDQSTPPEVIHKTRPRCGLLWRPRPNTSPLTKGSGLPRRISCRQFCIGRLAPLCSEPRLY